MTTPTPIAFEPAAKSAPPRRETGAGGEAHSFADTMQAQRAADRPGAGAQGAPEQAQAPRDQAAAAQVKTDRQPDTPSAAPADTTASTQAKTAESAAQARATDQAAAKVAEAALKVAANTAGKADQPGTKTPATDSRAATGQPLVSAKTAQAAAAQSRPQQASVLLRGDGVTVQVAVQNAASVRTRPVNAATAVAAHTAGTQAEQTDRSAQKAKTSASDIKASDDPTSKALRDALSSARENLGTRRGDDNPEAHAQRTESRPTGQRAVGGGMSPALRAAAEAVQQQLTGGTGAASTPGMGGAATPLAGQPQAQADAGALPAQSQTFDPVLQNTGPQPGGAGQAGSLAAAGKAAATAGTGAGNPAPSAPPAEQVAVQIQRAAAQGKSQVQIRLNPAELGRIDVKLDLGDDGHVRAVMSVDKPETLDLMQRDPRALERALQAAGLKTDPGSLSFNLRDDGTGHGQNAQDDDQDRPGGAPGSMTAQPAGDGPILAEPLRTGLPVDGRVDIRV